MVAFGNCRALNEVKGIVRELGPLLVAYSGGVDSTLLLKVAVEELGVDKVVAVTVHGEVHTPEELDGASRVASWLGARHVVISTNMLEVAGFAANSPERCFICRNEMYSMLLKVAEKEGLKTVVDGANRDDGEDYRPGMRAAKALGVRSPLAEAGMGKGEIRALARRLGLPNWALPASPCLSSRFPYGEEITSVKLAMVAGAERRLRELGFTAARVRHHGDLARIEVQVDDIGRAAEPHVRHAIVEDLRGLGYVYVTLDLEGFRSGSMNEALRLAAVTEEEP